jgi:hypothetical protein
MIFYIEKPYVLLATLLSLELDVCHPLAWFEGELCFILYICIFCLSLTFSSYSPKSLCFTYYTSLYLLNYAYHYARMSSNEM